MKKQILLSLLLAVLSMPFFSCSESDNNQYTVPSDAMWSIVTIESTGSTGTVFSFQKDNDSELITLTCTNNISSLGLPNGSRVMIAYQPDSGIAYKSGPITLYGVAFLNGTITKVGSASQYGAWASDPIDMLSLTRSGEFINVTATGYFYKIPQFIMVIDKETVEEEIPTAYIIFTSDNQINQTFHTLYGSFNISEVWKLDTCKGIKVVYKSQKGLDEKIFNKSTGPLTPTIPQE